MTVAQTLQTQRLTLRKPLPDDLSAYAAYCASDRSRFVGGPYAAHQAFEKFASMIGHWDLRGFGRYVMTLDGKPIGHVGPLNIDETVSPELTWTLWDIAAEGHGYPTEAAQKVVDHLMNDCGWPSFIIRIQPDNHGSCRIAEKIGAQKTGEPAPAWYPGAITYRLMQRGAA